MQAVKDNYQALDRFWLLALLLSGGTLSLVLADSLFDLSIFLSGILCVGLIAIGRREGYLVGLYSSLAYSILAYGNGLYGEVYLNLLFFVPTGVIGYCLWLRHSRTDNTVVMREAGGAARIGVAFGCVLSTLALGWILGLNPNQNTPFIDASTNVLAIAATFLMMGRYKEQWVLYILLNVLSIVMWALRVADDSESADLMVLMWSLFLFNAIFGCWRWHRGVTQQPHTVLIAGSTTCDVA